MGNPEKENAPLTQEQMTALIKGGEIGEKLVKDHPEIADLYRSGNSLALIAEEVIPGEVAISLGVAILGVRRALQALIPEEEFAAIGKQHQSQHGIELGYRLKVEMRGIFGLTPEQRSAIGKAASAASAVKRDKEEHRAVARRVGHASKINGTGIFGLTEEQKREAKIKGGKTVREQGKGIFGLTDEIRKEISRKALEARGFTPFSDEEINRLLELANDPAYQYPVSHRYAGKPHNQKISARMHEEFGIERTAQSLGMKARYLMQKKSPT